MAVMICTVVKGERWDTVERQQGAASLRDPGGGGGWSGMYEDEIGSLLHPCA